MRARLIIAFLRVPEPGRVKTRLAATVGDERALDIYERMLKHTMTEILRTGLACAIWYEGTLPEGSALIPHGFHAEQQCEGDLGERMAHAFEQAFNGGNEEVLIVGTDCPGLNAEIIRSAFTALMDHDAALGPSRDGGYYLLAMRRMIPEVFRNKMWSTGTVALGTIDDLRSLGLSFALLPELIDVDTEADLADITLS